MIKNKAGLFIRVSTDDQETANQKEALTNLIRNRNCELVRTYDYTVSASEYSYSKVDVLQEVFEDARLGNINILFIWSLDRITRKGAYHILGVMRRFNDYGVKVVSLQEDFVEKMTGDDLRDVFLSLLGYVAQFESKRRSERVLAAHKVMKKQGRTLGRPKGAKDKGTRGKMGYFGNKNTVNK